MEYKADPQDNKEDWDLESGRVKSGLDRDEKSKELPGYTLVDHEEEQRRWDAAAAREEADKKRLAEDKAKETARSKRRCEKLERDMAKRIKENEQSDNK